ncbi:MAG TPA: hypothetical protein VME17_17325 [Bryobacteraceae bacterium]|nr:hypothetical protein [Bryobacteraceae bacterium]
MTLADVNQTWPIKPGHSNLANQTRPIKPGLSEPDNQSQTSKLLSWAAALLGQTQAAIREVR